MSWRPRKRALRNGGTAWVARYKDHRGRVKLARRASDGVTAPLEEAGIDPIPHEFRHSWVTHLRVSGVDPADLADVSRTQRPDRHKPLHTPATAIVRADQKRGRLMASGGGQTTLIVNARSEPG